MFRLLSKINTSPSDAPEDQPDRLFRLKHSVLKKTYLLVTGMVFLSVSSITLVTFFQPLTGRTVADDPQMIFYPLLWGVAVICLASLGAFFLSKKLTGPLIQLSQTTGEISQGSFGTLAEVSSDDEIGMIASDINTMSQQLHELQLDTIRHKEELESLVNARTKSLQLRSDRLENILKTSSQGFWRVDNDMITQEINPRMVEILGYKQEDVIGRSIMDFVGIPNKTIFHKQIHLGKSLLSTEYEIELKQFDSTFTPCLFNATPLLDEEGERRGSFVMVSDISALKKTEQQLQEAKSDAEHASHVKSSFLANMSHEIRTPLNGIIGSLELLHNKELGVAKQQQLMATAQESADFLLMLLNDILDLSKIEADKIELEKVPVLPRVLLEQLQSMFIIQSKKQDIHMEFTVHGTVPDVLLGDEVRLTQVCTNLLSNAIKFTREGTVSIDFVCDLIDANHILLKCQVSDTGIGIPEEKQDIIFTSFSQADTSTTREFGGTGLGLSLCYKLCTLMGGDIRVESIPDRGSTFYFNVPLEVGKTSQLSVNKKRYDTKAVPEENTKPLDILVVDDNNVNRDVAEMFLEQKGHRVKTASNGLAALHILAKEHFDCIFMDIQMPKMDGVTATRLIRICEQKTMPTGPRYDRTLLKQLHNKIHETYTPIIALTANVFQSDRQKYLQAGMDDHLGKPIRGKEVYQALLRVAPQLEQEEEEKAEFSFAHKDIQLSLERVTLPEIKKHLLASYSFSSEQIDALLATSAGSVMKGLDELDQACEEKDTMELGERAHKLKGTLANLGLDHLVEKAREIELAAKDNEEQPYAQWLSDLRNELKPLREAL